MLVPTLYKKNPDKKYKLWISISSRNIATYELKVHNWNHLDIQMLSECFYIEIESSLYGKIEIISFVVRARSQRALNVNLFVNVKV